MPFATFTKIREVSSEDDLHGAANLIKGKKWKTKNVGEKSAYIILEMQDESQIKGIDIGNEHSAFVEVLVGKSSCAPKDFTEILITCSFMTPIESKSSNNVNRVRCFNEDALVPTAAEKKWSLIKIICTQPFNKHVQYGLSFIKVHVAAAQMKLNQPTRTLLPSKINTICENEIPHSVLHIGKFKFREDSPDSEKESDGASFSLFNRWKKCKDNTVPQTAAASIRKASNNIIHQAKASRGGAADAPKTNTDKANNIEILDRNRDDLIFGKEDGVESEREIRLEKEIKADKERRRLELQMQAENKEKRKSIDTKQDRKNKDQSSTEKHSCNNTFLEKIPSASTSNVLKTAKECISSPSSQKAKCPGKQFRPFNQLLGEVVLVISGIQNPDRGNLRNKAIALGAKYKGDWDNTCTHLMYVYGSLQIMGCAFKNTPKYNHVKGKGKIVTRTWIEKCYHSKKYLPWRRYALDSQELTKPESDEEIHDESLQPRSTENEISHVSPNSRRDSENRNDTLSLYELDVLPSVATKRKKLTVSSSDSDTDDEIKRIERRNINIEEESIQQCNEKKFKTRESKTSITTKTAGDIYEASTDEEDYLQSKLKQAAGE